MFAQKISLGAFAAEKIHRRSHIEGAFKISART
jgi:hypothetical protein